MSYHHILDAFAVILHFLLEDVPIPDDVFHKMFVQTIEDCDHPPLTGKASNSSESGDGKILHNRNELSNKSLVFLLSDIHSNIMLHVTISFYEQTTLMPMPSN